ncbi:MAG: ribonucleotide reductase N-terminal alpha domain-containing protein [Candidatus Omnitrophota bacterium]
MIVKLSDNAVKVLERRYLKKDAKGEIIETPQEMFRRVARTIADAEKLYGKKPSEIKKIEENFYSIISNLEFMPNSPTLMNAGRELAQLSACYVLPIEDSMEAIFEALKSASLIHKSGGGTGFSFSRLRPKNSMVKSTGGIASGPVSFMKVFDAATQAVKQGGTRRGANMGILRCDHPDILEFIQCKENNKDITNFNISVSLTDDFMKKLEKAEDYDIIDPHTKKSVGRLNTKEVFDLIVKQAHKNGEPGVIFIDRMNEFNPTPQLGEYESTNPCIGADSLIPTEKGLIPIGRLAKEYPEGGIGILNSVGFFKPTKIFSTGIREIFKIKTKAGFELKVTANHPILTRRGWVNVSDLRVGETEIKLQNMAGGFSEDQRLPFNVVSNYQGKNNRYYRTNLPQVWSQDLGILLGWLIGDGNMHGNQESVFFYFGKDDVAAFKQMHKIINNFYGRNVSVSDRAGEWQINISSKLFFNFLTALGVERLLADKKQVPESMFTAPKEAVIGFLKGLFSSDGTVNYVEGKSSYARLSSASLILLKQVQLLLINLGIFSRIYENRKPEKTGPFKYITQYGNEKVYNSKPYHELEISRQDVMKFINDIGFIGDKHTAKIKLLCVKSMRKKGYYQRERFDKIVSIEPLGDSAVYDLTEPVMHSFVANGMNIHNCGEQILLPYESCNLGSINLSLMLKEALAGCEVDWQKLKRTVHTGVRFLDNVIDMNKFPLEEIEQNTKKTRKIGLGVMGWGSMLCRLGIAYDSDEALKLAEKIMSEILKEARAESRILAEEKGEFPAYKQSIYAKKNASKMRNATLTTIAPTGTISIIAGPCSSGIEPLFALSYYRNVMDNDKLVEVDNVFEEAAKKRGFYSRALMEKIAESGGVKDIPEVGEDIKRVFVTAHDIAPDWHIKMQAVFQKYTDNAVSKTVNFPQSSTVEDVKKVYLSAYELGCKGVTIYRDKSREEQVLNIGKAGPKEELKGKLSPRPRPEVTIGTTTKVSTGCGNLYVTINSDENGRPFEVFTQMGKAGGCAASQLEAVGRLVSMALRAGVDLKSIIEQLKGIRCPSPSWEKGGRIFSCADAIARVIEKRLLDNSLKENISQEKIDIEPAFISKRELESLNNIIGVCPDCGGALRHEEGCIKCQACGFTKC